MWELCGRTSPVWSLRASTLRDTVTDATVQLAGSGYGVTEVVDTVVTYANAMGRAELAVLIAPVTVDDFVTVNLQRHKLPRKSTWFTPKARGGLVVAELER